jgi:PAS domain-containing protein/DNA-binding CsgD family transcriptional regulator
MGIEATAHILLSTVGAAATAVLAAYALRRRHEPGAIEFAALSGTFAAYAAFHVAGMVTTAPAPRHALENAQWTAAAAAPFFWLLFAASYTGTDGVATPRRLAGLAVVPVVTAVLVWTNGAHGLVFAANEVVVVEGLAVMDQTFGPWFWLFMLYTHGTVLVGSFLIARLVAVSEYLYVDQTLLLLVGVASPMVANTLTLLGVVYVGGVPLDVTPYGFAVAGVAFGVALFRSHLLELAPATRQLGRQSAMSDLSEAVVILGTDERIVYVNDAAAAVFEADPRSCHGTETDLFARDEVALADAPDGRPELTVGDRTYAVGVSPITDQHDRDIGYTVIMRDVTRRREHERRLRDQRDELRRLDRVNAVVRGVNRAVVGATTREGIATAVCEQLAASALYDAAWITDHADPETLPDRDADGAVAGTDGNDADGDGDATAAGARVLGRVLDRTVASAGATDAAESRLDAAVDAAEPPPPADGSRPDPPLPPAVGDGGDAAGTVFTTPPVDAASGADAGTWCLVPLTYGRATYGALVVNATREAPFAEGERTLLEELGGTVGYAMDAAETRELLASDAVTELEFRRPPTAGDGTGADIFLGSLSAIVDGEVALTGVVPVDEDHLVAYVRAEVAFDALADAVGSAFPDVDPRALADDDGGCRAELRLPVDDAPLLAELALGGTRIGSATATDGRVEFVAEVAPGTDVRRVVDRVTTAAPGTSLRSKRRLDRPASASPLDAADDGALTDRQREVIEAALRSGYFEWPRETNAEELADSLGIASSTLHSHLRKAERKLVGSMYGSE